MLRVILLGRHLDVADRNRAKVALPMYKRRFDTEKVVCYTDMVVSPAGLDAGLRQGYGGGDAAFPLRLLRRGDGGFEERGIGLRCRMCRFVPMPHPAVMVVGRAQLLLYHNESRQFAAS
jgi:hypothetical protein